MNKLMKLTAAAALLFTSFSHGQIELNSNLSVTGFIDMSAYYEDSDGDTSSSYDLDQMEIDFLYSFDAVTAQVDIDYQRMDTDGGELDLEQAFITYDLGSGSSITAGKFLSYHGWETAEPTGLYQYSYAYDNGTIPGYHNGITYDYSGDWGSFGVGLVDSVYDDDGSLGYGDFGGGPGDEYEYGAEAKLVLTPAEGLTLYFGYAHDFADDGYPVFEDRELFNFWTSYEFSGQTVAAEYNLYTEGDIDINQWLLMWNMPVSEPGSLTLRVSSDKWDDGFSDWDMMRYTAAYLHTVTDNLALVFEVSLTDYDGSDTTWGAVEALFTF